MRLWSQNIRARNKALRYSNWHCQLNKIRSHKAVQIRILPAIPSAHNSRLFPKVALSAGLAALLVGGLCATSQPAAAQQGFGNFFTYQQPRKRVVRKPRPAAAATPSTEAADAAQSAAGKTETKKSADKKSADKAGTKGSVYAIVSLPDQHVTVYDATGRIARSRVSTGQAGHRTPSGIYSVIGKSRFHRSNIYSGAPMPWMQRITWSGIAMHAGVVPGYPASHGCIRLPFAFAPQMFALTKMGARVVVASRDTEPFAISHPLLPLPKMQPAPAAQQQAAAPRDPSIELASADTTESTMTTAAVDEEAPAADANKLLDPIAYAAALKQRAVADKTLADIAAKDALAAAQTAGAEARQAVDDVRKAEADLATAEAKVAALEKVIAAPAPAAAPAAAGTPDTTGSVEADKTAAQAELERARGARDEARTREAAKSTAAFAAVETWKRAAATAEAAGTLIDQADRRREQVSVFISRKEGRIFIRQDWQEVWDAPVTFRDPDRPLGTHIFTAVDVVPDGSSVQWTAITIPAEGGPAAEQPRRTKGSDKSAGKDAPPATPASPPETAAGALDRLELPEGARERIAELLWSGGSIIVSDQPRSYEMGEYTDFIVLTR